MPPPVKSRRASAAAHNNGRPRAGTPQRQSIVSVSAQETVRFGRRFAAGCAPGTVLVLTGPLGSGKTTFVKGLARGLGIRKPIVSPTFVLRKRYPVQGRAVRAVNHLDAYRLGSAADLRGLLDEELAAAPRELWCVEWGEKLAAGLPRGARQLRFSVLGPTKRRITVVPLGRRGRRRP